MSIILSIIKRNIKMFFKDKGLLFTSLITPMILLVLYATFLGNLYEDSFKQILDAIAPGLKVEDSLINGCVGGQLFSSLLAVCTVTVTFCSNMLMVQDKVNGSISDLTITPVKGSALAFGYYIATFITTLIICLLATVACLIYIAYIGWYITVSDILLILLDVFILVMFGTALSSIINYFLSSQGQISAVGSIVSSGYGFICGAYMPISQFSEGLQNFVSFLPGTYGTSLLRNHSLNGVFAEMENLGIPEKAIEGVKDSIDCNIYFFDEKVPISTMYVYLAGATVVLAAVYILMNLKKRKIKR
ncbi:MAG: ABC transporter permease [Clostridia bacterium]|nr:ABC transporter permease [Clostridia bacterium]